MAEKIDGNVAGTFSGAANSDELILTQGGVLIVDAQRTAGSLTVGLEISLDGGSNYAQAYGPDGSALSVALSSSTPHCRFEIVVSAGQRYRLAGSSATTPTVLYQMGRGAAV